MQTDKSTMMNSVSLLVARSLHAVHRQEKNLPLSKLRTRKPKMKATCKSSMTDSQTLKNSDNLMNQALKVRVRITVPALLRST